MHMSVELAKVEEMRSYGNLAENLWKTSLKRG